VAHQRRPGRDDDVLSALKWAFVIAVWAFTLTTAIPALVTGRVPRWWRQRTGTPRLWATGQLLFAIGAAYGIAYGTATTGHGTAWWPIGPGLLLAGVALVEWARCKHT
jgi:hypothetical protein